VTSSDEPEGHESQDVDLVDAYRQGDSLAFDELFRRHHTRVRLICLRYVSDEMVAEDLVQETFLNLVRAIDRIDDSFNVAAWINRIAVNACQDELRRRKRRAVHQELAADSEEQMLHLADPDRSGEPERALELAHLRQLVWEVSKRLPERQRMVLTLRELQGLSYAAIARVMQISEAAVETLLFRARRRFREEYLLLESPPEPQGSCVRLDHLLTTVGPAHLQAAQRTFVRDHLDGCPWCREQHPEAAVEVRLWLRTATGQGSRRGSGGGRGHPVARRPARSRTPAARAVVTRWGAATPDTSACRRSPRGGRGPGPAG
jgi:RNA polymerase sigma-70 factor (ECF subfamily)